MPSPGWPAPPWCHRVVSATTSDGVRTFRRPITDDQTISIRALARRLATFAGLFVRGASAYSQEPQGNIERYHSTFCSRCGHFVIQPSGPRPIGGGQPSGAPGRVEGECAFRDASPLTSAGIVGSPRAIMWWAMLACPAAECRMPPDSEVATKRRPAAHSRCTPGAFAMDMSFNEG